MQKYLVSNVADRPHKKIYGELGEGAIFDLDSSQHGWDELSSIQVGDTVFVINKNRNVALGYEVTKIIDDVLLSDDPVWGQKVKGTSGGSTRVIFGVPSQRVDVEYSRFVRNNEIRSPKLDSKSGNMLQGFNCATFE